MADTLNIKIGKSSLTIVDDFLVQCITKRLLCWQLFISFIQEGQCEKKLEIQFDTG